MNIKLTNAFGFDKASLKFMLSRLIKDFQKIEINKYQTSLSFGGLEQISALVQESSLCFIIQ